VTAATLQYSAPQSVSVWTGADMLERDRLRIVLATIAINVAAVALLTLAPWSNWRTATSLADRPDSASHAREHQLEQSRPVEEGVGGERGTRTLDLGIMRPKHQ
jgi:hypothetical protein